MRRKNKKDAAEKAAQETLENEKVEQKLDETQEGETEDAKNEEVSEELSVEEKLTAELAELNDKYLRLYSDFDNYRKRTSKEKLDIIVNASGEVIKDLLTVVDDFERAIENNQDSTDAESIKEGFQLIYSKFSSILKNKGLVPMESKGTEFDYNQHEAITNIPATTEEEKGKVMDVIEKGYFLNDKVLRYAKVVVGQ